MTWWGAARSGWALHRLLRRRALRLRRALLRHLHARQPRLRLHPRPRRLRAGARLVPLGRHHRVGIHTILQRPSPHLGVRVPGAALRPARAAHRQLPLHRPHLPLPRPGAVRAVARAGGGGWHPHPAHRARGGRRQRRLHLPRRDARGDLDRHRAVLRALGRHGGADRLRMAWGGRRRHRHRPHQRALHLPRLERRPHLRLLDLERGAWDDPAVPRAERDGPDRSTLTLSPPTQQVSGVGS